MSNSKILEGGKVVLDKIVIFVKFMFKNFIKTIIVLMIVFLFFKLQAGCGENGPYWKLTPPTQDIKKQNGS